MKKFRAWIPSIEKLVDVSSIGSNYISFSEDDVLEGYSPDIVAHFDDITLLPYCSLNDYHNQEIYEGDIVFGQMLVDDILTDFKGVVSFNDSFLGFVVHLEDNKDSYFPLYSFLKIEIVGNIYEKK